MQVPKMESTSDNNSSFDADITFITYIKLCVLKQIFCKQMKRR